MLDISQTESQQVNAVVFIKIKMSMNPLRTYSRNDTITRPSIQTEGNKVIKYPIEKSNH